jgi:outer membrane protein
MIRSRLVFAAWAIFLATPLHAQSPLRLTLEDAIRRGLQASHRLAEISAHHEAAEAIELLRKSDSMPHSVLAAGYMRTNHVDVFRGFGGAVVWPDVPDNYHSRVDFEWPIFTGGRVPALERAAAADANAVGQDLEAARADLKLEITRAYWAVITARAAVDAVSQALSRSQSHLADVRNLLSVGLVPPSDVLTGESQQSRQQELLIAAENAAETSLLDLRRLVGLQPDEPVELVARIETPAVPSEPVAALVASARANRPERKALELRITGFGDRVTAAQAGRLPTVVTVGGYDMARPNPKIFPREAAWKPSWDASVNLNWSLFDGGRTRAEVAEASANQRAAEERLKDFDTIINLEVRQRRLDLASAQASIQAAEDGVRSATEARRVLAERFSAGVATNTDVLDAQAALLQAELDRTRALADAQLAAARLERALGR